MPEMVLISGYVEPARNLAESMGLRRNEWRYISDPANLYGHTGGTLHVVHGSKRAVERLAQTYGMEIEVHAVPDERKTDG